MTNEAVYPARVVLPEATVFELEVDALCADLDEILLLLMSLRDTLPSPLPERQH